MSIINNDKNLITLGLILIIILSIISYNLYVNSNYDINGNNLGCFDTIKNIFGILPIIGTGLEKGIDTVVDTVSDVVDTTKNVIDKEVEIVKNTVKKIVKKKEVFNIDSNKFTYKEAPYVCESLNSKLATYEQVINAHKKGANWCNYGWSANQMALYPTQDKFWKNLQKGPEESRNICGKPGVNGGYFDNTELKFGVNCYGYKPKPDPAKIIYHNGEISDDDINIKRNDLLNKFKNMAENGELPIRPFSNNKWSNYSYKKSSYIINPNSSESSETSEEKISVSEEDKDPNLLEKIDDSSEDIL